MRPTGVWVAEIRCNPEVEAKINSKHGVTLRDVRHAVLLYGCKEARWDNDAHYGLRLFARGYDDQGREIIVWLKPFDADEEIWELMTAYRRAHR